MIYHEVFSCIPNDGIHSRYNYCYESFSAPFGFWYSHPLNRFATIPINCRAALRQCKAYWKEKLGHTTIDIGIAPEKLHSYENGKMNIVDSMERLKSVKGHLVSFPLEFMCQEDLRPVFNESEFYTSPQVFH